MASSRLPSTALSPLCALGPPPDGFTHTRGGTLRRRETTNGENRELDEQGSRHLCSSTGLARCRYRRIPCLALATSSASTQTTHHGPGPYFSILETSRPGIWLPFSLSFFSLLAPALRPVGFGLGIGLGWIAESPFVPTSSSTLDTDLCLPHSQRQPAAVSWHCFITPRGAIISPSSPSVSVSV